MVVVGHSAGGHLAASLLVADWQALGLPRDPFAGIVSVSGVFDVAPLIHTSMNGDIRLTPESAAALDLNRQAPSSRAPLILAVGEVEPEEFHRQSAALAHSWAALGPRVLTLAGANHFTAIDGLAEPGSPLHAAVAELFP